MPDRGLDDVETDVFAPDPAELELWSDEVARSRQEYYTSPGPHYEREKPSRRQSRVPWWIPAGSSRDLLEQALQDLQAERHRSAMMRRVITRLQRRITELEMATGEHNSQGDSLQGLRPSDQDDEPAGDGVLLATVRGDESDEAKGEDEAWTA